MRLIFARHAESEANTANAFHNRESTHPLTATGRAQAEDLAARIVQDRLTAIYSSPLARAKETASFVSAKTGLPVTVEPALREYDVGVLEGKSHAEALPAYNKVEAQWFAGELDRNTEGGETAIEIVTRMSAFLRRLKTTHQPGDVILLVSHGGTLRVALPRILTGLTTTMTQVQLDHCETATAELVGSRLVARSWGQSALSAPSRSPPAS